MNKELEEKSAANVAEALVEPINGGKAESLANDGIAQQITITLFANGQLQLQGPLHDQVLMYGLIEMAKQAFVEQLRLAAAQRVQVASPRLLDRLKILAPLRKGH
ncbi:MAG: hypothetical protein NUV75_01325 [Gallionella sp.]|nr:hypothetical protein [Gallionella sp.]